MSREMKLTNLDCIHQIPLNWNLMDIKYVSSLINGDRSNQYPSGNDIKDSGVNFITSENLHNLKLEIVENSKYITAEKYNSLRGAKLRINDLIFCLRGSLGICSINTDLTEGTIASSLVVIRPNDKINPYYLNYSINSNLIKKQIDYWMNGSCAANLSAKDTREFKICVPPISEQNQIVNYLNSKCEAIDQAIQKQKDIVNKLIEYKQSVITQAVSKGLNLNVEMKDSGIDWIREIPSNWYTQRFKFFHTCANVGISLDKNYWSDNDCYDVFYTAGEKHIYSSFSDFPLDKYTTEQDLLLSRNGTPYVYYPKTHSQYSDHIIRTNIFPKYCKRFVFYCLQQSILSDTVDSVSIPTWSISIWDKQILTVPPLDEQKSIATFLDSKCSKINESIERSNKIIQKLEEYKKALIYNAVTGKIDCRNA